MRWRSAAPSAPIGVDLGARHIQAAQVREGRLQGAACWPRGAPGAALTPTDNREIARSVAQGPFDGRTLVVSVPGSQVMTGVLELPPRSSGAPIEQLARAELARRHGLPADSVEVACWDLPSPARAANRTYVMAVGGRRDYLNGLVDGFESAGFRVRALDVRALAVSRACRRFLLESEGTGAILDVDWTACELVLLQRGMVVYHRQLASCGLRELVGRLAAQFGEPEDAAEARLRRLGVACAAVAPKAGASAAGEPPSALLDALVAEMRVSLSYLLSQYPDSPLHRLLLIGGGAALPGLDSLLAGRLELDVRVVRPSDLADGTPEDGTRLEPALVAAIGLSQYPPNGP